MASVDVVNARKAYGGVEVIHGVSLSIADGEFVTLVGPSGCGKSTLLRMIAGLESITDGKVKIGPRVVNNLPPRDRDIAMVFQNYALYPHKTVEQNMSFGLKLRNTPKEEIQARVKRAADILHVAPYLSRYPRQLSGGQRQRVAMGRAIVRDPQVFLFDEPLSNLDAQLRVQMRAEIKELHQRLKTTTIYVTHDQIEAMTMGDRICLMKDGRIQQVDEPLEIYNAPANMYVAAFIGSPPMNFFAGQIAAKNGGLFFTEKAGDGKEGFTLQVDARHAPKLAARLDQPVYLGLRPEDIVDRKTDAAPGQIFRATVDLVEAMGAETLLYLKTAAHSCIARLAGQSTEQPAAKVELVAHMDRAHYFDAADPAKYLKDTGAPDVEKWQAACACIV